MKTQNTINSTSQRTIKSNQKWIDELKGEIQKIKKPFLNRVQFSKLRIQSKIKNSNVEKQNFQKSEQVIQSLIQKQSRNILQKQKKHEITQQSQDFGKTQQTDNKKNNFTDSIKNINKKQKAKQVPTNSYITQWQGRDKQRIFKNSSAMSEQFQTIFSKKLPSNQAKKKQSYSYRKDQKEMLQRIFFQLKNPQEDNISFESIYNFFNSCKLFYQVYDINPAELQDLVSSSAHVYPDKLTKKEFFDLFLVNPQSKKFDEVITKVQKTCCLSQQYWVELKQLFSQLDTFGCGTVRTSQFFHKMKTVSASKQLLFADTIYYPNVNRYYPLKKVIFELENKISLPEKLNWSLLESHILNFSHVDYPSIDEIFQKRIKAASIEKDSNTFLLKSDTIAILKKQFQRCPKFCESFVKCKFFCEELLQMEAINLIKNESVRQNNNGKGFVSLLSNIKILQLKGPQYLDLDEMLTYFSVKGFQQQQGLRHFKQSFDTKSTASDQQFQQKKRQERRVKRMKSQDHIKKIMMKSFQHIPGTQRKKYPHKPVKVQQFNLTKTRDHLTIRETKVKQMIEQKRLKQQSQMRPFISATPLPASMNSQRYQDEQNKIKLKRQLQKQRFSKKYEKYQKQLSYLQATTKLFENKNLSPKEQQKKFVLSPQTNKHFQPSPISWFVKERNLLDVIQGQKQERRKNRLRQTREKYQYGYWRNLPYQCDKNTNQENQIKQKDEDSLQIKIKDLKNEDNQKNQHKIKTTIVPDFAKLQKQFMQELESKKKMRSPTVVKQFNLSVSKKKPIENQQQTFTKRTQTSKKLKERLNSKQATPVIIGTTKKYQSMVQLTQMKIAQKNFEVEMKKFEQKQRKKKQKAFAKFMNKVLREENLKSKRQLAEKTTRRNDSSSRREHENQLRKIYEKVLSRPFLFQTATQEPKGLKKQGKNSKKNKKSVPQKVKIPSENLNIEIPPLKYIDSQEYPAQYENEMNHSNDDQQQERFMINEFQEDSNIQQQQSYIEHVIPNQPVTYKRNNFVENLNQSF